MAKEKPITDGALGTAGNPIDPEKGNADGTAKVQPVDPIVLLRKENDDLIEANTEIATINTDLNDLIEKQAGEIKEPDEEIFKLNGLIGELKEKEDEIAKEKARNVGKVKTYKILVDGAQYKENGQTRYAVLNETVVTAYPFDKSIAKEMRVRPVEADIPS